MNIEEAIKRVEEVKKNYATMDGLKDYVIAIETLLTAYDKEKEKNKELETLLKKQTELEQEKENLIKQGWLNE